MVRGDVQGSSCCNWEHSGHALQAVTRDEVWGMAGEAVVPSLPVAGHAVRLRSGQWDLTGNGYTIQFVFKGNLVDIVMLAK